MFVYLCVALKHTHELLRNIYIIIIYIRLQSFLNILSNVYIAYNILCDLTVYCTHTLVVYVTGVRMLYDNDL